MGKRLLKILTIALGIYIFVCVVFSALALATLKKLSSQNFKCQNMDAVHRQIKRAYIETLPSQPIIMLVPTLNQKIKILKTLALNKETISNLLGRESEKNYLLVFQNNAELRPSGGIWGAYGIMKVKDCAITQLNTFDTYYLDEKNKGLFEPPEELSSIVDAEWRFWNANWSPDFKKSVEQGLFFYNKVDPDIKFDGVIGPNIDYLLSIIGVSGQVKLPGHGFDLNKDNFIEKMIYEPASPAMQSNLQNIDVVNQTEKNFIIADAVGAMLEQIRLKGLFLNLFAPTLDALNNKDLILYSREEKIQKIFEDNDWAGRIMSRGNFASVVDANLGSKLDFNISKKIKIKKLSSTEYRIELTYKNNTDPNTKNQPFLTYRNLVRVFVPSSTKLIEQKGGQTTYDIKSDKSTGLSYMTSMMILKPSEQEMISFSYKVPDHLSNNKIKIIKQAGQHASFELDLH